MEYLIRDSPLIRDIIEIIAKFKSDRYLVIKPLIDILSYLITLTLVDGFWFKDLFIEF